MPLRTTTPSSVWADIDGSGMPGVVVSDVTKVSLYQLFPSVPRPGRSCRRCRIRIGPGVKSSINPWPRSPQSASPSWQTRLPAPTQVVVDIKSSGLFVGPGGNERRLRDEVRLHRPDVRRPRPNLRGVSRGRRGPSRERARGASDEHGHDLHSCDVPPRLTRESLAPHGDHSMAGAIWRGLPVVVQQNDAASGALLSTTTTSWAYRRTYNGLDGRAVRMVYPAQVDEYDGEPGAAPSPGTPITGLYPQADETDTAWEWSDTTTIPGSSVDRRTTRRVDLNGHETLSAAWGTVGSDTPIVTLRTWQVATGDPNQWLYRVDADLGRLWRLERGDAAARRPRVRLSVRLVRSAHRDPRAPDGQRVALPVEPRRIHGPDAAPGRVGRYGFRRAPHARLVHLRRLRERRHRRGAEWPLLRDDLRLNLQRTTRRAERLPRGLRQDPDDGAHVGSRTPKDHTPQQVDPGSAVTVWKYDPYGRLVEIDQPSAETLLA